MRGIPGARSYLSAVDPVVIVGAGVAGLACAQALAAAGRAPVILERGRGVGGRCATRRLEGQPVDLGPAFLHGKAPDFLAALAAVPAIAVKAWPAHIEGVGRPCQPEAFDPTETRLAFADGLTAFPKALARGLTVQTGVQVLGVEADGAQLKLLLAAGAPMRATTVVLAVAPEQAIGLLDENAHGAMATLRAMLSMSPSEPALSLAALYPADAPAPAWQVLYPEASRILQLVSHDSSKRTAPGFRALVFQTHPRWSGEHLDDPTWPEQVLAEGGRVVGPWAASPLHRYAQRWSYARTGRSGELAAPMFFLFPDGARLGVCGDRFAPGGGVEAAWRAGRSLAARILSMEKT